MAAGSDNPLRQAMINMMYLVLLALLALNVSAQVLNAFHVVHTGIKESNSSLEIKNQTTMTDFKDLLNNNEELTRPHYEKAQRVIKKTQGLNSYIESLKEEMIEKSGGYLMKDGDTTDQLVGAKNLDVGSRIMVEQDKGDTLQSRINQVGQKMKDILGEYNTNDDPDDNIPKSRIDELVALSATDPPDGPDNKNSWAAQRFQMVPVTAAVTILSKIQSDIKSTKSDILSALLGQVSAGSRSFDKLIPIVKPEKSVVNVNEEFKAEIMIGAYSSTQDPTITVEGNQLDNIENGRGTYKTTATTAGEKKREGLITLPDPMTGGTDSFNFNITFKASPSFATISPSAMTILYRGLDNPLNVSAVGYQPDQTRVSMSNGDLVQEGPGEYIARIKGGNATSTTITVSVEKEDGSTETLKSKEFRIRPVPSPTPKIANTSSGNIQAVSLENAQAVIASMGPGFAFEGVEYRVQRYRLALIPQRGDFQEATINGALVSGRANQILDDLEGGDRVIVDQIQVEGPDGERMLPSTISLKVIE